MFYVLLRFLIHRVELKVTSCVQFKEVHFRVSNSPCGVESQNLELQLDLAKEFLIHRVELKVKVNYPES